MLMTFSRRTFAGWAIGGLFWLASASRAAAHAIIVASVPAAEETVQSPPPYLVVRFNGRIEEKLSSVTLVGPSSTAIALFTRESAHPDTLIYRMPPLGPGRHQVKWRVLSADGHIAEGVFAFTVVASPAPR